MTNDDLRAAAQAAQDSISDDDWDEWHVVASPDRILALCEELERKTAALERIAL